jgi:hypothetical protein
MKETSANFQGKKPAMFYVTLVLTSFLVWIALWSFFGKTVTGFVIFQWPIPFIWVGWFGAFLMAMGRFWGWNDDDLPVELFLPLLMMVSGAWQSFMLHHAGHPPSVDEMLLAFDRIFGYPEYFLGRIFSSAPVIQVVAKAVYVMLVMPAVVVYLALRDGRLRRRLCASFALMGLSGAIFYHFCPAAGPIYVFRDYPWTVPTSTPEVKFIPHLVFNAVPSLHMAMAMLALLYSRYCSRLCQAFGWVCLVLTVLVTLGLGEHYVIDLILGVPFIVAIDSVWDRRLRRKAYGCFLLLLVWEFALCHGLALQVPTPVGLLLCCITLAVPFAPFGPGSDSSIKQVSALTFKCLKWLGRHRLLVVENR